MNAVEVLPGDAYRRIAEEIREHPERVHRGGHYAASARGQGVPANHPLATCWCAMGFVMRDSLDAGPLEDALRVASAPIGGGVSVMEFNDDIAASKADVAVLFDEAADRADRGLWR